MEDGVYLCSWSRSGHGFDVWVKSNPKVRASGATRDKAAEALVDAIQEAGGALRAVLEFDPPLPAPVNVQEFLSPRIVQIWGDEAFEQAGPRRGGSFANAEQRDAHIAWDNAHYQGGCCQRCRTPLGVRTDKTLELAYVRSGYGGGFVPIRGGTSYVFSERFLALLTESERASLELRRVERPKKSRVAYYELIGPSGPPFVGLAGVAPHSGWVCDDCGHRCFGYSRTGFELHDFVAQEDLPSPLPSVFTIGTQPGVELAATSERWSELAGQAGTKGMLSEAIGVAPPNRVDRRPPLPKLSERAPK